MISVFGAEKCEEQLRRLAESRTFHTSEALRRLLSYLAEKTLSGDADQLKEYIVGIEALGKPETYDPRRDSSVRFQVSKLRQRLAEYYRTEGAGDPMVVDLPRGRFKLTFAMPPNPMEGGGSPEVRKWRQISFALLMALAVATGMALHFRMAEASRVGAGGWPGDNWTGSLAQIWSPFVDGERPLLVCLGVPLFFRFGEIGQIRVPCLNDWESARQSTALENLRRTFGAVEVTPSYNFTGVGEAVGGFIIAQLLAPRTSRLLVTRTNALSWDDIVANDLVFIGPPKFNPKLGEIPVQGDFQLQASGIRNLHPAAGEPAFFPDGKLIKEGKSEAGETYALVSRLPGLHGHGDIFALAGNWTSGTLAAVEYVTVPAYASDLARRIRLPSGAFPKYYEVVVRAEFREGSPVQVTYVLHHVLARPSSPAAK